MTLTEAIKLAETETRGTEYVISDELAAPGSGYNAVVSETEPASTETSRTVCRVGPNGEFAWLDATDEEIQETN